MVKVMSPSEDRGTAQERKSKFIDITKTVFSGAKIVERIGSDVVLSFPTGGNYNVQLGIDFFLRNIHVYAKRDRPFAYELAETYEQRGRQEFTIIEDYR